MEFWLSYNNNAQRLRLPINPASIESTLGMSNTSINLDAIGEANLIGKTGLKALTLESIFPATSIPLVQYSDFPAPDDCVSMIESWMNSGQPIRLTITDSNINMACSIENFKWGRKDNTGNIYYSIDLKEYRFLEANTTSLQSTLTSTTVKRPTTKTIPKTYVVKKGDTLLAISKKLTGNSSNWQTIAKTNGVKVPSSLKVGQKLVIG